MAEENTRSGGYTSFSDMFDGGGPGASGGPFKGGGLLSAAANALTGNRGMGVGPEAGVGFAGYGYNDAGGNWVPASIDMRNGGGPGMAGDRFMGGGHYSGILNMLGIRPMGYNATASSMAPMGGGGNGGPRNPMLAPMSSPVPTARPTMPMPEGGPRAGVSPTAATPASAALPAARTSSVNMSYDANSPFAGAQALNEALYRAGLAEGIAPTSSAARSANFPAYITGNPNDVYSTMLQSMRRFR